MLTPVELDIMKAVWRQPPATVRDVQIALKPKRALAYTTVMTVMNRLYKKGFVTRRMKARAHVYEATVNPSTVRDEALAHLIDNFFGGSKDHLKAYLEGNIKPRPETEAVGEAVARSSIDETLL